MCKGCKEHIHTYSHMHPQQCRNNEIFVVGSQIADAVELKRCFPFLFLILGALEIVLAWVFVSSSKRKVCALVSSSIQLIKWVLSILHMHTYTRTYIHTLLFVVVFSGFCVLSVEWPNILNGINTLSHTVKHLYGYIVHGADGLLWFDCENDSCCIFMSAFYWLHYVCACVCLYVYWSP